MKQTDMKSAKIVYFFRNTLILYNNQIKSKDGNNFYNDQQFHSQFGHIQ